MLEDIRIKLLSINTLIDQLRVIFDIDTKKEQIKDLSESMSQPGFWDDSGNSAKSVQRLKILKSTVEPWEKSFQKYKDLKELAEIVKEQDADLISDLTHNTDILLVEIQKLEFITLLDGEFDRNNAILSINAGAGGTESCDWVGMLFRMYSQWAQSKGYKLKTTDILVGEEAGIKNITVFIEGEYAYGYLKAERGVHRLVRISPFDSNKRRHTSFASVDVIPEITSDTEVKIEEKDLRIDTYRASGPGGQHMQKTDSAVRITHLPTGLVVQCQNERSQYQNKQTALKILRARIFELEREKREKEIYKTYGEEKKRIEWGSQIRSYVMHPYSLVKDHRTEFEMGDVNKVMDGGIDGFIEAYLKFQKNQ
ncbi:MAG: peptide chain release factor 2 [Candidatus Omnitrophota bacterium]